MYKRQYLAGLILGAKVKELLQKNEEKQKKTFFTWRFHDKIVSLPRRLKTFDYEVLRPKNSFFVQEEACRR